MINPVKKKPYKPAYNILGSFSIKQEDEREYEKACLYWKEENISKGEALMIAWREVFQYSWDKNKSE